jgi:hypothetical protein
VSFKNGTIEEVGVGQYRAHAYHAADPAFNPQYPQKVYY